MNNYQKNEQLVLEQIKSQLNQSKENPESKELHLNLFTQELIEQLETLSGFFQIMYHHSGSLTRLEIEEFASRMDISVKHMMLFMGNLIEWTMLQKGEVEIKPEKVNLQDTIIESIQFFEHISVKKNVSVIQLVDPDIYVLADRNKLNYILRNLISNGIKFTPEGGNVDISSNVTAKMVEIEIADNGIGIPGEIIKKICKAEKPFSSKGTAFEKGNGYGLLSVKKLIELNKGWLNIKSEIYKGTIVTAALPATR